MIMNSEIKAKIEILAEAKKMIASKQHEFVCHAIQEAGGKFWMREAAKQLVATISDRLGPCAGTVSTWLINKGFPEEDVFLFKDGDAYVLREYRIRWIDDMIRTLKNGGEL